MAAAGTLRVVGDSGWKIAPAPVRRGAAAAVTTATTGIDPFAARLQGTGRVSVTSTAAIQPATRRGAPVGALVLETVVAPDEKHVLMARHEDSGAITFHFPSEVARPRRRGATSAKTVRFSIAVVEPVEDLQPAGVRRGFVSKTIRTVLLNVAGGIADKAMPVLGLALESALWRAAKRKEGWKTVTPEALAAKHLPELTDFSALSADPFKPNLLFIHGTFSSAASAYAGLANALGSDGKTLFETLAPRYGNRTFAFDHFTVSRNPAENARMLLDALPAGPFTFDVVTHSRGGLLLRHIVELQDSLGQSARKFKLGRAALVASPNAGTPLASPQHFDKYVTWIANLLDLFPDNPFTDGVAFVADAIGWIARHVVGALPGLVSMDRDGAEVRDLQRRNAPADAYSALVSNFEPQKMLLQRMADTGVDIFFETANDLVVPTEGGWEVDPDARNVPLIPSARIGCYGPGGNIPMPNGDPVSHISFFGHRETVDFLVRALAGTAQGLPPVDPSRLLPSLFGRRRAAVAAVGAAIPPVPAAAEPAAAQGLQPPTAPAHQPLPAALPTGRPVTEFTDEVFHLSILDVRPPEEQNTDAHPDSALIIAMFRNARAVARLQMRGGLAGKRFKRVIDTERAIRDYVNGKPDTELPAGKDLITLGCDLFETLFPGEVRRLYDVARAEQLNRRINLIFTSQIAWLADLPWEFVYDPARQTFLAASEVNFTRNVITAVPGDRLPERDPLRILIVVAQPLGLAHLSVDDEKDVITSGFRRLIDAGLATVEVLLDATPALLHQTLENGKFDVLHFIGHGEYDSEADIGYLVFEDESGAVQKVDSGILQQIICRRDIRLVFLNACETGEGGRADFNRGVAPALVQAGIPAVIGNQFSVLDISATAFARHLYWALACGRTIGDAARESRVAVNYSISGEAIDWAVPVLFARDPSERLCSRKGAPAIERDAVTERRRVRRRSGEQRKRVALWDVQRIFPHLDRVAEQLTQAQELFSFEAVSITAPIGTWRREAGTAYLNVNEVEKRLSGKPGELGVDSLFAFTNLGMRSSKDRDLFFWGDERFAVISIHGYLDRISGPELSTDRLIANAVAGLLLPLNTHRTGPKNCPMYYNAEHDVRFIAGPLELCAADRRKLKDKRLQQAVENILRLYD